MKTLKSLLYAFIAVFVLAGCDDDGDFQPGASEDPDCYNVYFPVQENAADKELDPDAETKLSFIARRTNSEGAITVPVKVQSPTPEIFTVSELKFEDGQEEATFDVTFPDTKMGTKYECDLSIEDPLYASLYGEKATGMSFSVTRVKWNQYKGEGGEELATWNEVLIGLIFEGGGVEQGQCRVFERDDRPGYFRFENPYNKGLVDAMFGTNAYERLAWEANIVVDARDPEKVFIPVQEIGLSVNKGTENEFGPIRIASIVSDNFTSGGDDKNYGKLVDGVISFPKSSVVASMEYYQDGAFLFKNDDYVMNLVLPGAKVYDYSLSLSKSEPVDGVVKLGFKLGADVAKVKYAFFEGTLTDPVAESKSKEMADGTVSVEEVTATGTVNAVLDKTGVYTVVGNIYNANDELQGFEYLTFGYIKQGEDVPVVMTVRTELSWEYEAEGHTPENSIKAIMFGEDIKSGYVVLAKTEALAAFTEAQLPLVAKANGKPLTAAQLEKINSTGYSTTYINLSKGTSYTLLVLVDNGYRSKLFAVEQSTQGDPAPPSPLELIYTFDNITDVVSKADLFNTTWNYYAIDASKSEDGPRKYIGKVTISEDPVDSEEDDFILLKGLADLEGVSGYTGEDVMKAVWDNGLVFMTGRNDYGKFGNYYVANFFTYEEDDYLNGADYAMIGAYVNDGIIAFVPNPNYVKQGYTFTGIYIGAFNDAEYKSLAGFLSYYKHLLLVDPKVDPNGKKAAAVTEKLAQLKAPTNYVELRGPALIKAVWDGTSSEPAIRGFESIEGVVPAPRAVDAKVTFTPGIERTATVQLGEQKVRIK